LEKALDFKFAVVAFGLCMGLVGYLLATQVIRSELAPGEDQGVLKTIALGAVGATITYLDRYLVQMEGILNDIPEIARRLTVIQTGDISFSVNLLRPWEQRSRPCLDMLPALRKNLETIPGLHVYANCPSRSLMGGATERPLEIVVQTNKSFKELVNAASMVRSIIERHPGVIPAELDWDLAGISKDWLVKLDRDLAAAMGVDVGPQPLRWPTNNTLCAFGLVKCTVGVRRILPSFM